MASTPPDDLLAYLDDEAGPAVPAPAPAPDEAVADIDGWLAGATGHSGLQDAPPAEYAAEPPAAQRPSGGEEPDDGDNDFLAGIIAGPADLAAAWTPVPTCAGSGPADGPASAAQPAVPADSAPDVAAGAARGGSSLLDRLARPDALPKAVAPSAAPDAVPADAPLAGSLPDEDDEWGALAISIAGDSGAPAPAAVADEWDLSALDLDDDVSPAGYGAPAEVQDAGRAEDDFANGMPDSLPSGPPAGAAGAPDADASGAPDSAADDAPGGDPALDSLDIEDDAEDGWADEMAGLAISAPPVAPAGGEGEGEGEDARDDIGLAWTAGSDDLHLADDADLDLEADEAAAAAEIVVVNEHEMRSAAAVGRGLPAPLAAVAEPLRALWGGPLGWDGRPHSTGFIAAKVALRTILAMALPLLAATAVFAAASTGSAYQHTAFTPSEGHAWTRGPVEFVPAVQEITLDDGSVISAADKAVVERLYFSLWPALGEASATGDASVLSAILSPDLAASYAAVTDGLHKAGRVMAVTGYDGAWNAPILSAAAEASVTLGANGPIYADINAADGSSVASTVYSYVTAVFARGTGGIWRISSLTVDTGN
jgi:hypothetical protein